MSEITQMQRQFVTALYEHPGIDPVRALRIAGYQVKKEGSDRRQAYRWMHNEKVLAAIQEYGANNVKAMLPLAVGTADQILRDPKSRDRAKVMSGIMDRAGLHAVTETHTTVTHNLSIDDMRTQLRMLLSKPMMRALIPATKEQEPLLIDADFTEVSEIADTE